MAYQGLMRRVATRLDAEFAAKRRVRRSIECCIFKG